MLLFTIETLNAYKLPTSCSYAYPGAVLCVCVCAAPEHILFFFAFHWDEPGHLKLRFEKKPSIFLTLCFTLVGVIGSFGNLIAYKLQKFAPLYFSHYVSHSNLDLK